MLRIDRYFKLHRILAAHRYPVSRRRLEEELNCSAATVKRVINELRDFGAPIDWDAEHEGYRLRPGEAFELPGLWFNGSELYALLVAQHLLATTEPGLLSDVLQPLRRKIDRTLALAHLGSGELLRRVRILRMAARNPGPHFSTIADAALSRKRVLIEYESRGSGETSVREVSPQRLVHYRDNWYVDGWCHRRKALRSFALERIRFAKPRRTAARDIAEPDLDAHFRGAYGIFGGAPTAVATLRFSRERARWVADEHWHGEQKGRFLEDGRYELTVPYSDDRELLMDILKHGAEVEVLAPVELRERVREALRAAMEKYRDE